MAPLLLCWVMILKDGIVFRLTSRLLIAMFCAVFLSCAAVAQDSGARRMSRLAPPPTITCNRNQLTSWTGVITGYRRESDRTWLEISTDEKTVERTTLGHEGQANASSRYLLWNKPFLTKDWAVIEQSPGVLKNGMRATVWVCEDGKTPPIVDWQPPRKN
jgi:hypothetical protein